MTWILNNNEKALVLQNAITVLLNTVPFNKEKKESKDNDLKSEIRDIHKNIWRNHNLLQPQELLGCHCIAEFALSNESVLRNLKTSIEERTNKTLFQTLYQNHPRQTKIQDSFKRSFLYQNPANIQNDLCMRNLIQACISYKNPKSML